MLGLEHRPTTEGERRFHHDLAALWKVYGPALREKSVLDGGMTWKAVNGAEYLCRYRQDPVSGKKKFTSLGRRSAETEAVYEDFVARRDAARSAVAAHRDDVALLGRLARAYSLANLPSAQADVMRLFWRTGLDERVTLFGGSALYAYEGVLDASPGAIAEDAVLQYVPDCSADTDLASEILDAVEADGGERPSAFERRHAIEMHFRGGVTLELLDRDFLLGRAVGRDEAGVLRDALSLPRIRGLTMARDASPVEMRVFDLRTYALAACLLARDDDCWAERGSFAVAMVVECWPEKFDAAQEELVPEGWLDPYGGSPRL